MNQWSSTESSAWISFYDCMHLHQRSTIDIWPEKERETAEEPTANPLEDCYPPISVFGKSLYNQAQKRLESR